MEQSQELIMSIHMYEFKYIHIRGTLVASYIYRFKYAYVDTGSLYSCVNITILTIHIDLSLIRVFRRTSQTDMNTHITFISSYIFIDILIEYGFIATCIHVNMLRYGSTV